MNGISKSYICSSGRSEKTLQIDASLIKVAVTLLLKFNGAKIVDLSALDDFESVLAITKTAVAENLGLRFFVAVA